jgi:choline-glycine betaine transporter
MNEVEALQRMGDIVAQAPFLAAVIVVVVVFLKHIRESDAGNREVMRELRDAINRLRESMNGK